ncbi:AzlD domain-containing protein [Marinomonas epiphytica]
MTTEIWLSVVIISIGTLAVRLVPFVWMRNKLQKASDQNSVADTPVWLTIMGPTMIAAMFGTSVVPGTPSLLTWLSSIIGLLITWLVWRRTQSLGWPICWGVSAYGVAELLLLQFGI